MAAIDAEIRSCFATPVVVSGVPEAAGINADLERLVREREKTSPGAKHSNLGDAVRISIAMNFSL